MKMLKALVLTSLVLLGPLFAFADGHEGRPAYAASRTVTFTAEVTAINHETREVTLTQDDGNSVSFVVREEARNLAQVEVGDKVFAEMYEEITAAVYANAEGYEAGAAEIAAGERTQAGQMPGGAMIDTMVIAAVVEDINIEKNTFRLRMPDGEIREFVSMNPENLVSSQVGDLVVITITHALGVIVQHPDGD